MVAVTDTSPDATPAPAAVYGDAAAPARNIGVVPTASLLTGAMIATVWFWIPLTILIIGIFSIPSIIGFALAAVVFVYVMRGVEWVERLRSEAVFGLGIPVPPRPISPIPASNAGFISCGWTSAAPGSGRPPPSTTYGWPTTWWSPRLHLPCWHSPS